MSEKEVGLRSYWGTVVGLGEGIVFVCFGVVVIKDYIEGFKIVEVFYFTVLG